jgi:hypothetical protein
VRFVADIEKISTLITIKVQLPWKRELICPDYEEKANLNEVNERL